MGKSPLATGSGTPRGRQEDRGEPSRACGFLELDPACIRHDKASGCWELKNYEQENSSSGR